MDRFSPSRGLAPFQPRTKKVLSTAVAALGSSRTAYTARRPARMLNPIHAYSFLLPQVSNKDGTDKENARPITM